MITVVHIYSLKELCQTQTWQEKEQLQTIAIKKYYVKNVSHLLTAYVNKKNTHIDNAKGIDLIMQMHKLIEHL